MRSIRHMERTIYTAKDNAGNVASSFSKDTLVNLWKDSEWGYPTEIKEKQITTNMTTNPNDLGPLQSCKLDDANWQLRQGHASEANALAYVEMWNRPGMRLTRASLHHYTLPQGAITLTVPEIRISE